MNVAFAFFAISPFVVFLVLFVRTRFWKDIAGWSVFVLTAVIVLVLALVVARYVGWSPPGGVRELIYSLVGLAGYVQLFAYLYTRRGYRRDMSSRNTVRRLTDDRTR